MHNDMALFGLTRFLTFETQIFPYIDITATAQAYSFRDGNVFKWLELRNIEADAL
jgi:hypothetical protein